MTVEMFRVCAQNTRLVGLAELALAPHEGSAVYLLWLRPRYKFLELFCTAESAYGSLWR